MHKIEVKFDNGSEKISGGSNSFGFSTRTLIVNDEDVTRIRRELREEIKKVPEWAHKRYSLTITPIAATDVVAKDIIDGLFNSKAKGRLLHK